MQTNFTLKSNTADHAPMQIGSFRDFYAFLGHVKTCRAKRGLEVAQAWYDMPVFYFSNHRSIKHHQEEIAIPQNANQLDFELELGLIIAKQGINIKPQEAWQYVAGFTIINDFSARDLQKKEMTVGLGPSKGKDFATAVGPHYIPLEKLKKHIQQNQQIDLQMTARINGKTVTQNNANTMHFNWPQIIAHASKDATLMPGDLLGSGTVAGGCILELGPENTGGWLKPGDIVELEIQHIGTLRNKIIATK